VKAKIRFRAATKEQVERRLNHCRGIKIGG
jgi:hypothetical protein